MSLTRMQFATQCLIATVGVAPRGARRALCAWSIAESGTRPCDGRLGAAWNVWNTTLPLPGSTYYNHLTSTSGVQNYASAAQGAEAFARTLHGDARYLTLLDALARPFVYAHTVLHAIDGSPWGTHEPLLGDCLTRYNKDRAIINLLPVGA